MEENHLTEIQNLKSSLHQQKKLSQDLLFQKRGYEKSKIEVETKAVKFSEMEGLIKEQSSKIGELDMKVLMCNDQLEEKDRALKEEKENSSILKQELSNT